MRPDLYLKNGTVVVESGVFHGGVMVANSVITQVVADTPAVGKEPARCLYYKDVGRDPLEELP